MASSTAIFFIFLFIISLGFLFFSGYGKYSWYGTVPSIADMGSSKELSDALIVVIICAGIAAIYEISLKSKLRPSKNPEEFKTRGNKSHQSDLSCDGAEFKDLSTS